MCTFNVTCSGKIQAEQLAGREDMDRSKPRSIIIINNVNLAFWIMHACGRAETDQFNSTKQAKVLFVVRCKLVMPGFRIG